jgi:hypothetical protein
LSELSHRENLGFLLQFSWYFSWSKGASIC